MLPDLRGLKLTMSWLPGANLSAIPIRPPPPGISSNFVDPPTLAPTILAVNIVMMTWALLFVVIRLYVNFHARRGLATDDYFCIISTVLVVGWTGLNFTTLRYAVHIYDIPLAAVTASYNKRFYAVNLMIGLSLFFAKSTILILYFRIFAVGKKNTRSIRFGLAWCFLIYLNNILMPTYFCAPRIGERWGSSTCSERCSRFVIYAMILSAFSLALDLYIFILPVPMILRLQMSRKRRVSILGIFGTAFLGIIAAVARLLYQIKLYKVNDGQWDTALTDLCITVEINVAIIVGSIPAFASFFNRQMPGASWLAAIRSLISRSTDRASSSKFGRSGRSNTGVVPSGESVIPGGHARDKGYLELHDTRHPTDYELGSVRTEIQGTAASPSLEEGVVHKSINVYQTVGQESWAPGTGQ